MVVHFHKKLESDSNFFRTIFQCIFEIFQFFYQCFLTVLVGFLLKLSIIFEFDSNFFPMYFPIFLNTIPIFIPIFFEYVQPWNVSGKNAQAGKKVFYSWKFIKLFQMKIIQRARPVTIIPPAFQCRVVNFKKPSDQFI